MTDFTDPDAIRAKLLHSVTIAPPPSVSNDSSRAIGPAAVGRFRFAPRLAANASVHANRAPYVVKGLIEEGTIGAIFGPRGSGKSFLALGMARAIASGEKFCGLRTKRSVVLYLALEGSALAVERRFAALAPPQDAAAIHWDRVEASAFDDDGFYGCVADFIAREKVALVLLDTLTALIGEKDENSNAGMAFALRLAQKLTRSSDAAFCFVAHSGKDESRGVRGHSSFEAAADFLVRVQRDGDRRNIALEKVRDGKDGLRFAFDLKTVTLGTDTDGDTIETLIANDFHAGEGCNTSKGKPLSGHAMTAYDSLVEAVIEHGVVLPTSLGLPEGMRGVECDRWRDRFYAKLGDDDLDTKRKAFQRARSRLHTDQRVGIDDVWAWCVEQGRPDTGHAL